MKTKILMSLILGITMIVIAACDEDGQPLEECQGANIVDCAQGCIINPSFCAGAIEMYPELVEVVDSLRAVSNLPIRE